MTSDDSANWITFEHRGPVTIIRLNRPEKLNAFHFTMDETIVRFVQSLNAGEYDTRCLILTGEGRAFCSGADVGSLEQRSSLNTERKPPWRPPHSEVKSPRALRDCDVPVIGALNGYAVGLGFGLALATDLRIASDDARFQVAQLKRGLFGDHGLGHFLPQQLGIQRGLELMLTARMVEAREALDLGLVLKVVPKDELLDAALELAEQIVSGPPLGIAASKRVVYMNDNEDLHRVMDYTSLAIGHLFNSEDNAEGIRSFMERREPQFQGR